MKPQQQRCRVNSTQGSSPPPSRALPNAGSYGYRAAVSNVLKLKLLGGLDAVDRDSSVVSSKEHVTYIDDEERVDVFHSIHTYLFIYSFLS